MLTTDQLRQRPATFRSLTGLTGAQFDQLYQEVAAHYDAAEAARLARPQRQRARGAGRKFSRPLADRLLMALVWVRVYSTYEVLGLLFGFNKSTICRRLSFMLPLLREVTSVDLRWPDEHQRKRDFGDILRDFPDLEVLVDATEQRIRRPQSTPEQDTQRAYFSGKKKKHALKTQIAIAPDGRIQEVSASVPGATSDLTLLRQTKTVTRLTGGLMCDAGYQGLAKDHPDKLLYQAHRASRGHPLTEAQREENRRLSHYRIQIEHVLAQLKIFQVLAQVYRHQREAYNGHFRLVAALANRRAGFVPLLAR
jgi:hypothetical protein